MEIMETQRLRPYFPAFFQRFFPTIFFPPILSIGLLCLFMFYLYIIIYLDLYLPHLIPSYYLYLYLYPLVHGTVLFNVT